MYPRVRGKGSKVFWSGSLFAGLLLAGLAQKFWIGSGAHSKTTFLGSFQTKEIPSVGSFSETLYFLFHPPVDRAELSIWILRAVWSSLMMNLVFIAKALKEAD